MKIKAWGPLLALLALFGAASTGVFYSNPHNQPKPTKAENRDGPKRKPVAIGAPNPGADEARQKKNEEEGFKLTDWLLVLFNGILALYTWRLYLATRGLGTETAGLRVAADKQAIDMKDSIAAAQKAADAAELSARAAIGLQLPIIRITPEPFVALVEGSKPIAIGVPPVGLCRVRSLAVSNVGNSKAFPFEVGIGWTIAGKLPERPTYNEVTPIHDTIWEPDKPTKLGLSKYSVEISAEDHARIIARSATLWFYCYVAYEDFIPQRHDVGMCWRWKEAKGLYKFSRDHSATAYNWRRQRE